MPDVSAQATPAGSLAGWRVGLAKRGEGPASALVSELVAGLVDAAGAKAAAAALLATLSEFSYDPQSGALSLDLSAYATDAEVSAAIAALKGNVAADRDTLAELAAAIAAIDLSAYAALAGATFTGAVKGVTPAAAADFAIKAYVDSVAAGAPPDSATYNRYIGWAAQRVPTDTEIIAGDTFTSNELTIPNPDPDDNIDPDDTPGWLWFAVPTTAGAPAAARFDGNSHDILGGFSRLASGTFAGHLVYATNAEQDPAILGTGSRTLTLEYS